MTLDNQSQSTVMASEGPQTDDKSPVSPPPAYCWTDIQTISKNGNETSSHDAVLKDIKSLKKKSSVLAIILAMIALISLIGLIIAICALTKDSDGNSGSDRSKTKDKHDMNSDAKSVWGTSSGSACGNIKCGNGGSCINIPPDEYICICTATFYGRKCEHKFPVGRQGNH